MKSLNQLNGQCQHDSVSWQEITDNRCFGCGAYGINVLDEVPNDHPVEPLHDYYTDNPKDLAQCGHCGRWWDDSISTSMTPTPSARCPFEAFHDYEDDDA